MKPECRKKLEEHLSKKRGQKVKLTQAEVDRITKNVQQGMRNARAANPERWRKMSEQERVLAGHIDRAHAIRAAADAAALGKLQQLRRTNALIEDNAARAATSKKNGGTAGSNVKDPHIRATIDQLTAINNRKEGAIVAAFRQYQKAFNDLPNRYRVPMFGTPEFDKFMLDVVQEWHGETSNNPAASEFARTLNDQGRNGVTRLNEYGANIQMRERYVPHNHDGDLVGRVSVAEYVSDRMQWDDKETYINADGSFMDDAQIAKVLEFEYQTITQDGRNKTAYDAQVGEVVSVDHKGSVYNPARRPSSLARVVHFKDFSSWAAYHAKYSRLKTSGIVERYISRMAEDVALTEEAGPDPRASLETLIKEAHIKDDKYQADRGVRLKAADRGVGWGPVKVRPEMLVDSVLGREDDFSNTLAESIRAANAIQVGAKLVNTAAKSVPIDSIWSAMYSASMGRHGGFKDFIRLFQMAVTGADKQTLTDIGLGGQVMQQLLHRSGRRMGDLFTRNATGTVTQRLGDSIVTGANHFANTTTMCTGLNAWTNKVGALGEMLHSKFLARAAKFAWDDLDQAAQQLLSSSGITARNWDLVRQVPIVDFHGHAMASPDAVHGELAHLSYDDRSEIIRATQAFLWDGRNKVTNEEHLVARTFSNLGTSPNSLVGSYLRTFNLFRGVAAVVTANMKGMINRQATMPAKVGMGFAMMTGMAMSGYMGNGVVALINGQDLPPLNVNTLWKSWLAGDGLGWFTTMISSVSDAVEGNNRATAAAQMTGPLGGDIGQIVQFAVDKGQEAYYAYQGDEYQADKMQTRSNKRAVQFLRQHTPILNWTNFYYAKLATDRLIFDHVNEAVYPGLNQKQIEYGIKRGQPYWWAPGENSPERAPAFGPEPTDYY